MNSNVLVSIKGLHKTQDSEDTIQTLQNGQYKNILGNHVIRYEEILEDETLPEAATVTCMLKITPDSVTLTKKGAACTQMQFVCGKTEESVYHTPLGSLHLTISTTRLEITQTENQIKAEINYHLDMNGSPVSQCELSINISTKEA